MPARRLDRDPTPVHRFDVVGLDVPGVAGYLGHVGLVAEAADGLRAGEPLRVTDMQPPLVLAEETAEVHALGTVPLTAVEAEAVEIFIAAAEAEYAAANRHGLSQYVVRPHSRPVTDADGTVVNRRYSCAGFVLEAYRAVGIDLVDTDEATLPPVDLAALRLVYTDVVQRRVLENDLLRERLLGLAGDGPWPIVLSGYLLNSLARPASEIRRACYHARPGDAYFPGPLSSPG